MSNNLINTTNWNYGQFTNNELKAIISMGASPDILDDEFFYFVTVLDQDDNEVHQEEFTKLQEACDYINQKYSEFWDFKDLSLPEETGGCGSCSAH